MFDNLKKIHLPFFLSFPFLSLFVINSHLIEFDELVWVVLVCGIIGAIITAFVKSKKAVLLLSISWMLFYIFGHIRLVLLDEPDLWHIADFTAPMFTMTVGMLAFGFWKRRTDFSRVTHFANIAGLTLVTLVIIQIGMFADQQPQFTSNAVEGYIESDFMESVGPKGAPNILYIIPDGYGRNDVLLDVYGYDNTPFTNTLEDMGFKIGHGFSNYVHTHLSMSSTLNMQYLDPTDWNLDYGTENHQYAKQMIEDNSVIRTLKENGYTLVNIDSQFEATRSNPLFDYNLCSVSATDNELLILFSNTSIMQLIGGGLQGDLHENRLCAFENVPYSSIDKKLTPLGEATETETIEPYFVMMHILMPHPPYLFDSEGNHLEVRPFDFGADWDKQQAWDTPEAYIEHLKFFNSKIIDTIIHFDGIVIIQSDHGIAEGVEWSDVKDEQVYNRLANFTAVNHPDFDPDRSPVNTWRQIFGLPLIDDKYYFSEYKKSYDFIDYTTVINDIDR